MSAVVKEEKPLLKLNLGSGPTPKEGFISVDSIKFNDDIVQHNLGTAPWPFDDNSVSESYCSHFFEHLTNFNDKWERIIFLNELYRVTVPGGTCLLIFPHLFSNRYYGDPTHKEPFGEFGFYYLDPNWRLPNAPHTDIKYNPNGYNCHWNCTWNHTLHQDMKDRNQQYIQHAMTFWKEACQDTICTMVANKSEQK